MITIDQKQALVTAHGLDPSQYTTDDEGTKFIPITDVPTTPVSPTSGPDIFTPKVLPIPPQYQIQQSQQQPQPQNSPFGTFLKSAAQEAPSSLGAGLSGAGGLALGTALAPETGGLSFLIPLLTSLGGSMAGGSIVKKLQSLIEPQSMQSNVAQAEAENPKSALLGRLATLPLGGFNPSPKNVINAGGALGKLASTVPFGENAAQVLSNPEMQNLMNVGLGAGVGAGANVAQNVASGQPLNLKDILLSGATGALFSKPNAIGKRIGFHDTVPNDIYDQLKGSLVPTPPQQPIQPSQKFEPSAPQLLENRSGLPSGNLARPNMNDKMAKYKATPESLDEQLIRMSGEGGEPTDYKSIQDENNKLIQEQELLKQQKLQDFIKAKAELEQQHIENATQDLQSQIENNRINAESNITKGTNPQRAFTKNVEAANQEVLNESPEDLANRRLEEQLGKDNITSKYSQPSELTKTQEESIPQLKQLSPTRKWFDTFKKYGIESKGINIDDSGEVVNTKGEPVAGQTLLEDGLPKLIKLNLNKGMAGADTPIHELYHAFIATLRQSKRAADVKLVRRYDSIVEQSPDYQSWKTDRITKGLDASPEEYQATNSGYEFLNRFTNSEGESSWEKWKNDFGSYLKTRFSKHADTEDYQRLLNNYLVNDSRKLGVDNTGIKQSKFSQNSPEDDAKISLRDYWHKTYGIDAGNEKYEKYWKNTMPEYDGNADDLAENYFQTTAFNHKINPEELYKRTIDHIFQNKYQPESKIPSTIDDYTRYQQIQDRMKELISTKMHGGDEFANLWKEAELIKNKTGGMPPKKVETKNAIPSQLPNINERADELNDTIKSKNNTKLPWITSPIFRSQLDTVRRTQGPEGEVAAKALEQLYPQKDQYFGKYFAPVLKAYNEAKPSKDDLRKVNDIGIQEFRDKKDYTQVLTPKQKTMYDAIKQALNQKQQDQIAANQPVTAYNGSTPFKRLPQVDPYYWPNQISPQATEVLTKFPNSPTAKNLESDFLAHQQSQGISPQAAAEKWKQITLGYEKGAANLTKFNAVREQEGVGLPDSMMRNEPLKDLYRYFTRVSSDRAWHDVVESQPDNAKVMGLQSDPWGNPIQSNLIDISGTKDMKDILENLHGETYNEGERKLKSFNRIATSLMLGPLTNVHIMGSSLVKGLDYMRPWEAPKAYSYAMTHLIDSYSHALENGYVKKNLSLVKDLLDNNTTSMEKLNALASTIGNLSGRDLTNNFTKSFLQGVGEWLVGNKSTLANTGDKAAIKFMERVDPEYTNGKTYSQDEINKLGSNFANLVHGAHDPRTLPGWMLKDTAIQPFFSLASWNISQTNQWMRHVLTPATQGDFIPLIMSTLGAVAGGYVIKELRQKISDKKAAIPSLTEIINSSKGLSGNLNNLAYQLSAMSSYTGFAGIYSVIGKAAEDLAHKNIPQGAAFPLDEVISNPVHRISQFVSAMMSDPDFDYIKGGIKLSTDIAKENIQLGRIGLSWLANLENIPGMEGEHYLKSLNAKTSELRRFKMVEGLPYEAQSTPNSNPYVDMGEKTFKRTGNLGEAAGELPELIKEAFLKSEKAGGSIDVLRSELGKLKTSPYETMPSPERMPQTFVRYLSFLSKQDGPEEASKRYMDYLIHNNLNKVKSKMVPSL